MSTTSRAGRPPDDEKREAILDAAVRAFFDHGYAATSVEGVAAAAGVSKVTVYNAFQGKAGLFSAAVDRECRNIREKLVFAEGEGDLAYRLTHFARDMHDFLFRPQMKAFELRIAAEAQRDPAIGVAFLEAGPNRMKQALAHLLDRARRAGELEFEDPLLVAEQFAALVKGMADLQWRFAGQLDMEQRDRRIAAAVQLILRAYSPSG